MQPTLSYTLTRDQLVVRGELASVNPAVAAECPLTSILYKIITIKIFKNQHKNKQHFFDTACVSYTGVF